ASRGGAAVLRVRADRGPKNTGEPRFRCDQQCDEESRPGIAARPDRPGRSPRPLQEVGRPVRRDLRESGALGRSGQAKRPMWPLCLTPPTVEPGLYENFTKIARRV